jgi:hypothetical protein
MMGRLEEAARSYDVRMVFAPIRTKTDRVSEIELPNTFVQSRQSRINLVIL